MQHGSSYPIPGEQSRSQTIESIGTQAEGVEGKDSANWRTEEIERMAGALEQRQGESLWEAVIRCTGERDRHFSELKDAEEALAEANSQLSRRGAQLSKVEADLASAQGELRSLRATATVRAIDGGDVAAGLQSQIDRAKEILARGDSDRRMLPLAALARQAVSLIPESGVRRAVITHKPGGKPDAQWLLLISDPDCPHDPSQMAWTETYDQAAAKARHCLLDGGSVCGFAGMATVAESETVDVEQLQATIEAKAQRIRELEEQISACRRKVYNLRISRLQLAEVIQNVCLDVVHLQDQDEEVG